MSKDNSAPEGLEYGEGLTVGAKCDDTSATGNWFCTNCQEHFPHNGAMHSHGGSNPTHLIAWNCHKHGVETP